MENNDECKCCKLLKKDIEMLIEEVRDFKKTCSRMDNHISSVETVYSIVRKPLGYLFGGMSSMFNRNELPQIESTESTESTES